MLTGREERKRGKEEERGRGERKRREEEERGRGIPRGETFRAGIKTDSEVLSHSEILVTFSHDNLTTMRKRVLGSDGDHEKAALGNTSHP